MKRLGDIDLSFDNFRFIQKDAEKLRVEELVTLCKQFLDQDITVSNCVNLMLCAEAVGRKDIETKTGEYFWVSPLKFNITNHEHQQGALINVSTNWATRIDEFSQFTNLYLKLYQQCIFCPLFVEIA